jgi:hypothetical protein
MRLVLFLIAWALAGAAAQAGHAWAQGLFVLFLLAYLAWCVAALAAHVRGRL